MSTFSTRLMLLFMALLLFTVMPAAAATYYVDFAAGDDTRAGTSPETAWKHAPGDKNAAGAARAAKLAPGDTVLLKGGVTYRGSITVPASGEKGRPVTYKGDGWGKARAVIDGAAPFGKTWTRCDSADLLRGNKAFANVYYAAAPKGYRFTSGTYENADFIYPAQAPSPKDPFHFDRIDQLRMIPKNDPAVSQTDTSITDPRHFTSSDPAHYDGASVLIWQRPNVTRMYKITGYDPATHTVKHEKVRGAGLYRDRDTHYALINHPAALSGPGQYWFDEKAKRLYVWPRKGAPGDNEYGVVALDSGINATGRQHVVIEGFIVRKFVFGIRAGSRGTSDVMIRNNEIRSLKSNGKYAIHAGGTNILVEGNRIVNCQRAVGIMVGGKDVVVRRNHVERTSRQGIWLMGVEHCQVVGNTVVDINGTHSNGVSVYLFNKDVLVAGNRILRTGSALTYHGDNDKKPASENLTIFGNLVDGATNSWGHKMGDVALVNNTFLGRTNVGADSGRQVFINNIAHDGGTGTVRNHNIYTALGWWQKPNNKKGWSLAKGDIDWSAKNRNDLFADAAKGDYHPKAGSPTADGGIDPRQYLPTKLFPDYDFTKGLDGEPLVRDGVWVIGAYGCRETATRKEEPLKK